MVKKFDFLVIGSGIAGMSFALKVAHKGKVALVCKSGLEEANTYFAQGGVASVTNLLVDNFEKHIEDTMIAGDWISDRTAVEKVVREAPAQIQELISSCICAGASRTTFSTAVRSLIQSPAIIVSSICFSKLSTSRLVTEATPPWAK